ncbi:MAG TPA: DUF2089 domain-containing protein [Vicinamibacterales bacterium]|nr:DUF2089 domain-containing protein [Vicinamibacterales bacterium]
MDWQNLTKLTNGEAITVERVRLKETGVAVEGSFDLPPLAQLPAEDQIFVAAFIRCHGSIKDMEKLFGVSYPTIKNRLNRIGERLPFAEVEASAAPRRSAGEVLLQLERGEISARDAIARMRGDDDDDRHD